MPRIRLPISRKIQFEHIPSPEIIEKALPNLYGSSPRILDFMLNDLRSEKKEFIYSYQKSFLPSYTVNNFILKFWNYKLIKIGEKFQLNCPGHNEHNNFFIVQKKRNWKISAKKENDTSNSLFFIPSKYIKFLQEDYQGFQTEYNKEEIRVGDFCYIKSSLYRPRYEEDFPFKIIWKGTKYVRVEPLYPKYKLWKSKSSIPTRSKVNQYTYEICPDNEVEYFASSVYNMNIPFTELELLKIKNESYYNSLKLLDDLGI
jgi:hypothetical protein